MPSPFPGMDPYIEDPEIWSDFHAALVNEIRTMLNRLIQPRYVARLTPRVTYDLVEISQERGIRPDVGVWRSQPASEGATQVVAAITPAPIYSQVPLEEPLQLYTVEIRETGTLELVTAIEILSPVNKRPGHEAHRAYQRKRRELLRSQAHLLEIDLLRGGERPPLETPVPLAPYYVTVSRVEQRPTVAVWPIQLQEMLPVLPVPLLEPDPDAPLELGAALATVYEEGAYQALIDYRRPPPPPKLSEREAVWLDEHLRAQGIR
jgi:hypothetical protein